MDMDNLIEKAQRAAERVEDDLADKSFKPSMVLFTDDGNPRLIILPTFDDPQASRGPLAWITKIAAASIDNLSEIIWLMDSWQSTSPTKKDGSSWEQGEMQEAVENNTENADLVYECLSLNIIDKDGTLGAVNVRYDRNPDDTVTFLWDDATNFIESDEEGSPKAMGNFPSMLRQAVAEPKMRDIVLAESKKLGIDIDEGLGIERQRLHTLVAMMRHVFSENLGIPILLPTYNDTEREVFKRLNQIPGVGVYTEKDISEIHDLEELFEKS